MNRLSLAPDFGGLPKKRGIAERLRGFLGERPDASGNRLLLRCIEYACRVHGFDPDLLVGEWVDGVLGDHYPLPVRVSLANLPDGAYEPIGRAIAGLLADYHAEWRARRPGAG